MRAMPKRWRDAAAGGRSEFAGANGDVSRCSGLPAGRLLGRPGRKAARAVLQDLDEPHAGDGPGVGLHDEAERCDRRAAAVDPHISIATVYRTVRLFEESGILERHDFRDGRSRYEEVPEHHHDHLIDMKSGKVVEFVDEEIERLQNEIAKRLGYKLVDHRLELYGVPLDDKAKAAKK